MFKNARFVFCWYMMSGKVYSLHQKVFHESIKVISLPSVNISILDGYFEYLQVMIYFKVWCLKWMYMFLRTNFSEDVYRTTPKTFLLCSSQARFIYFPYRFEMLYCSKKFYCEWQMFLNCCQDESLLLYQVVLLKTKPSIQKKIIHIY